MTKKIIISFIVALVLFFIVAAAVYLILKSKSEEEKIPEVPTAEEKIQSVTAPERTEPISPEEQQRIEKLIESATAPSR